MPIITEEDVANGFQLRDACCAFDAKVAARIEEILKIVCECYGADASLMWWEYEDDGPLSLWSNEVISIDLNNVGASTIDVAEFPEEMHCIPVAWLSTEDSAITAEVLDFIQKSRDKKAAKAKARKQAKVRKEELKRQAAAKLTPEERKALGLPKEII